MKHDAWRGLVGRVTPTKTSRSVEELLSLLPDGIGVMSLYCGIRHGTLGEFTSAISIYEEKIAELAADKVDVIHPAGTPPFMLLGWRGEQEQIERWERKYGVPIFTSGTNQVRGMRALGMKRIVSVGYDFEDTSIVHRYLTEAGFDVVAIERLPGAWEDVGSIASTEMYRIIKRIFLSNPGADGIYIQGGKIRMLDMVEPLEQDLEVPVLHPAVANAWEVMLRLRVRQPKQGYGRLLSELPRG